MLQRRPQCCAVTVAEGEIIGDAMSEAQHPLNALPGDAAVSDAGGNVRRQVFLDGDGLVEVVVKAQVGHAEAAQAQQRTSSYS